MPVVNNQRTSEHRILRYLSPSSIKKRRTFPDIYAFQGHPISSGSTEVQSREGMESPNDSDKGGSAPEPGADQHVAEESIHTTTEPAASPVEQPIEKSDSSLTIKNLRLHQEAYREDGADSPPCSSNATRQLTTPGTASRTSHAPPLGQSGSDHGNPVVDRGKSLRTGSGRPLPPIGMDRSSDEVDAQAEDLHARTSHPTILQRPYRRESLQREELEGEMPGAAGAERSVSFQDDSDKAELPPLIDTIGRKSPAVREVHRNIVNGEERVSVSIATETEWSWLESLKIAGVEDELATPSPVGAEILPTKIQHQRRMSTPSHDSDLSDMDEKVDEAGKEGEDDGRGSRSVPPLEIDAQSEYSEPELVDRTPLIPSIGPPRIIQYQREVHRPYPDERPLFDVEGGSPVAFRESLLELGEPEGSSSADLLPSAVSEVSIHLPDIREEEAFCEFCHQELKLFPTQEMRDNFDKKELYCCEEYQKLVEFAIQHSPLSAEPSDSLIDITPHAPYGSKQARRAAKERAAARLREREMARQRAAGANQANFYAFARQMKTINYALSSQRCMDEGWTIRPVTPDDTPPPLMAYEPIQPTTPSLRPQIKAAEMKASPVIERFYPGGERFMIMFRDGSGTVYYSSGSVAIQIVRAATGQFLYIAQDEVTRGMQRGALLALFEPNGRGTCYHKNGNIRLNLDQSEGMFADSKGAIKKRWHWWDRSTHVHAPPFQPICFALNSVLSVRCLAQDQIFLGFSQDKMSLRFNVGVKLQLVAPENIPTTEIDEDALYISEIRAYVQLIKDRINNQLQFSKSPKVGDIHPPRKLKKDFLRNDQRKQELSRDRASGRKTPIVTVK